MDSTMLDKPWSVSQTTSEEYTGDMTDETLIDALCKDKAEWAMEKLYERYKRYVYSLAHNILRDSFLAEDVVQEVFFVIWRKAVFYQREQGSVKSWLQTIARNRAIDKVRSLTHHDYNCSSLQDADWQGLSSPEPEPWEQVWQTEQSTSIRRALLNLPVEQGTVIKLGYFSDYTHMEIARDQQIPLGTVKGRMRLGLQKIKHLLQAEY